MKVRTLFLNNKIHAAVVEGEEHAYTDVNGKAPKAVCGQTSRRVRPNYTVIGKAVTCLKCQG